MAVESTVLSSKMVLRYDMGLDENNNPIYKSKTYPNVKISAADQDFYDVAAQISTLQSNTLTDVRKVQEIILASI